jgi:uncharacterized protein
MPEERKEETSMKRAIGRACILLMLSAILAAAGQQPKVSTAKEADIRELLHVTGMDDIVERQMTQMANQMKPVIEKSLPPGEHRHEMVETFTKKFLARANSQGLIRQVIPVYEKYLTDEDVKTVLSFYKSRVGQRLLKIMPEMMKEASAAGQQYGEQIASEVLDQMAQQYPELREHP